MINESITPEEWTLLDELRDVPDDDARADLTARILDLIRFAHDPWCPHAQADGVPCTSVTVSCHQCHASQKLPFPWGRAA
jgi:hypothetical protein